MCVCIKNICVYIMNICAYIKNIYVYTSVYIFITKNLNSNKFIFFSFVLQFIENKGLQSILDYLSTLSMCVENETPHAAAIASIKALMNNSVSALYLYE